MVEREKGRLRRSGAVEDGSQWAAERGGCLGGAVTVEHAAAMR